MSTPTIARAAELLECEAAILRESCTDADGEWSDKCELLRAAHDEMLRVAGELRAMLAAAPEAPEQAAQPVAQRLGECDRRDILDAIRFVYDLGYNDARNARAVPGDSAPGYAGQQVEAAHGAVLIADLERRAAQPANVARLVEDVTVDDLLAIVRAEVVRATDKFPTWPTDPLHASGVVQEESGELAKAVLQRMYEPHKSTDEDVRTEAVQTAAMAVRFLLSMDRYLWQPGEQHAQNSLAAKGGE